MLQKRVLLGVNRMVRHLVWGIDLLADRFMMELLTEVAGAVGTMFPTALPVATAEMAGAMTILEFFPACQE